MFQLIGAGGDGGRSPANRHRQEEALEAALLRRANLIRAAHPESISETPGATQPTSSSTSSISKYPTAAERAARRRALAASLLGPAAGGTDGTRADSLVTVGRRLRERDGELAEVSRALAAANDKVAALEKENARLQDELSTMGSENALAEELRTLKGLLATKETRINALNKSLSRSEKARQGVESMQRAAEQRLADLTPECSTGDSEDGVTTPDAALKEANGELRRKLVVARFRELGAQARHRMADIEILRVACPNVPEATLQTTLKATHGDLKTAMVQLQTKRTVATSSAAMDRGSVTRCGLHGRVSAARGGAATGAIAGGNSGGRDKIVVLSTRGRNAKLGLKFKTVHGPAGEAAGEAGLEVAEVTPGGVAGQSGSIEAGDCILKLNSESLKGVQMSTVRRMLRMSETYKLLLRKGRGPGGRAFDTQQGAALPKPEEIEGADPEMAKIILNEIVDSAQVQMSDVIGLKKAKQSLTEIVVFPSLYPELFTGLRKPCKGLLLFGPPGNGKTMLAKAIASTSQSTFYAISASSLTSKWVGQSEKLVRALFACGRATQPSILFIDEVDSILSERRSGGQEGSARLKTEFLVSFDGVGAGGSERVLVMAATNLPWEIDAAAMRRLPKRVYVPMPNAFARHDLVRLMLTKGKDDGTENDISGNDIEKIVGLTDGYSNSDMASLVREAAAEPMREAMESASIEEMMANRQNGVGLALRPMVLKDFMEAARTIKPSYGPDMLAKYQAWADQYGTEDSQREAEQKD